jgi:predicted transcriptional regulator
LSDQDEPLAPNHINNVSQNHPSQDVSGECRDSTFSDGSVGPMPLGGVEPDPTTAASPQTPYNTTRRAIPQLQQQSNQGFQQPWYQNRYQNTVDYQPTQQNQAQPGTVKQIPYWGAASPYQQNPTLYQTAPTSVDPNQPIPNQYQQYPQQTNVSYQNYAYPISYRPVQGQNIAPAPAARDNSSYRDVFPEERGQQNNDFSYIKNKARIAVYDDISVTPRVVEIDPGETRDYIGRVSSTTYNLAKEEGGVIPYTVILEIVENFIHAYFKEPVISILDGGNTIRFADQGPGIVKKSQVQLPGYSSATEPMKSYIRGVGSGFPVVKDYLDMRNGRLYIDDNINHGTVITITVNPINGQSGRKTHEIALTENFTLLSEKEKSILKYIDKSGSARLTDIVEELGLAGSTVHKTLTKLQEDGYITREEGTTKKYYRLTDKGNEVVRLLS